MDSGVGRSTRYREFCRQCLAIVSVTLAAEVLLLHNVKLTASWHVALIRIQDRNDLSTGSVLEEAHKMENDSTKDRFSRRGFLGIGSAALATVAGSLVFDQGLFSEDNTFLLSDRVAHTPPDVLSKNFGLAERALTALPTGSLYIFPADLPRSLAEDKAAVGGPKVQSPIQYTFKMEAMAPTKRTSGGEYASSTRITFLPQGISPPLRTL